MERSRESRGCKDINTKSATSDQYHPLLIFPRLLLLPRPIPSLCLP